METTRPKPLTRFEQDTARVALAYLRSDTRLAAEAVRAGDREALLAAVRQIVSVARQVEQGIER